MEEETALEIEVIASEDRQIDGEKGLFGTGDLFRQKITKINSNKVAESISAFCQSFSAGIGKAGDALDGYELKTVEINVEMTVKGEIRLIASAAADTKGGIKLVFNKK